MMVNEMSVAGIICGLTVLLSGFLFGGLRYFRQLEQELLQDRQDYDALVRRATEQLKARQRDAFNAHISLAPAEEQPFLRCIFENGNEDGPRLVFADWLEERGQCERAEGLRNLVERRRKDPRRSIEPQTVMK